MRLENWVMQWISLNGQACTNFARIFWKRSDVWSPACERRRWLPDLYQSAYSCKSPSVAVDDPEILARLSRILVQIAEKIPLVFPIHPRTRKNLEQNQILPIVSNSESLFLPATLSYVHFMNLEFNSRFVITDSGGIQEETTYLGIPCLTVRPNKVKKSDAFV